MGAICLVVGIVVGIVLQQWITSRNTVVGVRTPSVVDITTPPSEPEPFLDRATLRAVAKAQLKQLKR